MRSLPTYHFLPPLLPHGRRENISTSLISFLLSSSSQLGTGGLSTPAAYRAAPPHETEPLFTGDEMALNTEYRIAFKFEHLAGGPAAWTVRNYRVTTAGTGDSAADLAMSWVVRDNNTLRHTFNTNIKWVEVVVASSLAPTVPLTTLPVNQFGDFDNGLTFPIQLAGLIRLTYSGMDARHPGRWFQPYLPMWANNADFTAWVNLFQNLGNFLAATVPTAGFVGTVYSPVVWKRASSTSSLVTGNDLGQLKFYTQRRRAKDPTERTLFSSCVGPL